MTNRRSITTAALLLGLLIAPVARGDAGAASVVVTNSTSPGSSWTVDRLKTELAAEVKPISYTAHGHTHAANAVPLLVVLRKAGVMTTLVMDPKADPKTKNAPLRLVVVVRGRDGYTATFALAELLPDIGHAEVWLTLDADGQPLAEREAPVALVAPSDAKPGRWVRGVASVTVVDPAAAPTTRPVAP